MRLLVDAQAVQSSSSLRGIGRYGLALLHAIVKFRGDHQVEVLLGAGDDARRLLRAREAVETFLDPAQVHVYDADWPWRTPRDQVRRQGAEAAYEAAVVSLQPDAVLVLSVFEGDPENVLSVETGLPTAAVLYDLIPAADPATYLLGPGADAYWRRYAQLQRCDLLLSISDYSAGQARALMGAATPTVRTVWGGPFPPGAFPSFEESRNERPELVVPERFLLTVGGDHPRKNLDRLVAAWGRVPPSVRAAAPLVVACGLSSGTARRLDRVAQRAGVADGELVLTGRVSDRRLAQLYRSAAGFVFPSTEEGLGLPPVEAMHAGCPTLLARSSSLVELVNDPVAFVDPEDEADLARGMTALLTDDALRARLGGLADQAARTWTWQAAARRTWQALEELPSPAASAGQDLPAPLPLDARGLPQLSVSPGPAVVGADGGRGAGLLPASPRRLDGAAAPLRTALAPVTALVLERGAAPPAALVAAGGVELPVVEPDQLALAVRHDPLPALRERLHGRALPPAYLDDLVAALHAPARWWLERPRPVWLLLGTSWTEAEVAPLRAGCDALGADLVWAGPAGAVLGDCVDAVAVESGALDPEQLLRARCRGADVAVLGGAEGPVGAWWDRLGAGPGAWQPLLERWAGAGRRTGWPWRRRA